MKKQLLTLTGLLLVNGLAFGQPNTIQVIVHNTGTASVWLQGIAQGGTFWNLDNPSGTQVFPGTTYTSAVHSGWIPYTDVLQWYPANGSCNEAATLNSTPLVVTANPGIAEYYIGGGCGTQTGGGPPASTNSEYCCTINNTSGAGQLYGLANADNGLPYGLDSCGDTLMYVAPGQTVTICTDASPTAHVALFTATGPVLGLSTPCGGMVNPAPDGTFAPTNLIGTPIPNGSGTQPGNTNSVTIGFGAVGSEYTNSDPANSPINFATTNTGVASNGTLMQGFSAEFSELVTIAGAIKQSDIDTQGSLGALKSVETGIASSVSPLHGDLGGIATSLAGINTSVSGVTSAVNSVGTDVNALKPDLDGILTDANSLPGMSNLLGVANGNLVGISNQVNQVVSNTSGTLGDLTAMSNYVARSFAYTNDALGNLSEQWADGVNRNNLTNLASAMSGAGALGTMQTTGNDALASAESAGTGPASVITGGADASFWTISETVAGKTYSFDLNPMDNAGIAEIAGICRTFEEWTVCFAFVCLVMNLFDKYFAAMAQTAQTQSNRTEVLGNSVGQLSGAVYLPVMIGCMLAIPLFIGAALTSSGASWFASVSSPPLSLSGHSHPIEQAIWLADQFMPLNFVIASALWYLFIRLTAAPVWATSVVILKTLIS